MEGYVILRLGNALYPQVVEHLKRANQISTAALTRNASTNATGDLTVEITNIAHRSQMSVSFEKHVREKDTEMNAMDKRNVSVAYARSQNA